MEAVIVSSTIILWVLISNFAFVWGIMNASSNSVFLGTVHWAGDYFYYLSQFAQGRYNWFYSYDLYTGDFPYKTLVGWVNVFLGRLFYLSGADQVQAYFFSNIIFVALFLLLSYILIKEIFPGNKLENKWKRAVAFILFSFGNAFPNIANEAGKLSVSFYDYWFNNGLPLNRLVSVPHQLLARICIVLILISAIRWWNTEGKANKLIPILIFILGGVVLASVEPVAWMIVSFVIFFVPIIYFRKKIFYFFPFVFFSTSGLPIALYLKQLFSQPPFSQLAAWELSQSISVNIINFILANGPVMLISILGFFLFFTKPTIAKTTALSFTFLTVLIFNTPLPKIAGIVNVRFLPAVTTIFLSSIASEFIWSLFHRTGKKVYIFVTLTTLLILTLNTYPLYLQVKLKAKIDKNNSFYYVDKKVMDTFDKAREISNYSDLFLVIWPFNSSFPAFAGRHTYSGHPLLTIDSARKDRLSTDFFYGEMEIEEMEKFLDINKIKYVIAYSYMNKISSLSSLNKLYDSGMLSLYEVEKS